jgi:hypothetical protein
MTTMADLIEAYLADATAYPAIHDVLADALVTTGPLRHGVRLFWIRLEGKLPYVCHIYILSGPPTGADPWTAPRAADTPIPR